MVERFKLGFSNRMLGPALPDKNRRAGAEMRGQLERLGVFRETGHEHLRGSLVVPVMNLEGDVVQLYGRKINDNLRERDGLSPVPSGADAWRVERGGVRRFQRNHPLRIAHRRADVLVRGPSQRDGQLRRKRLHQRPRAAFEKHGTKRVYIAYDADEAGNKAAASWPRS